MRRSRLSLAAALAVASSAVLVGVPAVADAAPKPKPDVPVQLIAMNDFHGRIRSPRVRDCQLITAPGPDGVLRHHGRRRRVIVGGAANVASTVKQLQADLPPASGGKSGSFFVGAGDLISASPFESSVFKDEPTIEVLDAMGLDVVVRGQPRVRPRHRGAPPHLGGHRRHLHRRRHRVRGHRRRARRLLRRGRARLRRRRLPVPGGQRGLQGDRRADAAAVPGLRRPRRQARSP